MDVEVEKTAAGGFVVLHTKECEECSGQGKLERQVCAHPGTACPCSGAVEKCDRCGGEGVVVLADCDCDRCADALELAEHEASMAAYFGLIPGNREHNRRQLKAMDCRKETLEAAKHRRGEEFP